MVDLLAKIARAERLIGRWYLRTIQEADLQESVEVQTATTDVAEADPPGSQVVGAQYRSQVAGTADRARTRRDRDSVADYEHPQSQQAKRERLHVEETPRAGVEISAACIPIYPLQTNSSASFVSPLRGTLVTSDDNYVVASLSDMGRLENGIPVIDLAGIIPKYRVQEKEKQSVCQRKRQQLRQLDAN